MGPDAVVEQEHRPNYVLTSKKNTGLSLRSTSNIDSMYGTNASLTQPQLALLSSFVKGEFQRFVHVLSAVSREHREQKSGTSNELQMMSFKQMLLIVVSSCPLRRRFACVVCVLHNWWCSHGVLYVLLKLAHQRGCWCRMKWHRSQQLDAHPLLFEALQKLEEIPDAGQSILSLN